MWPGHYKKLMEIREEFVKRKWKQKRKLQVPIYIDLDSDNKQFKKKCRPKFSMIEAMYKRKKIDVKIQKRK